MRQAIYQIIFNDLVGIRNNKGIVIVDVIDCHQCAACRPLGLPVHFDKSASVF
jgi:hypothetical protein